MKKLLMILTLALLPAFITAQEFQAYTANVKGDSVRVRTGAGLVHPPIHVLEKGEKLTVIAIKEGWAIIQLPANAPCWISEKFVVISEDGKTYTVTGKRVNLRAAANTSFFPIGQAEKDQVLKVCIDGRSGTAISKDGFVQVIPPVNAKGAVAKKFIEKVVDIDTPAITKSKPVAEASTDKPVATEEAKEAPVVVKDDRPETPKPEPTPAELDDERKTFAELESLLRDELKKEAGDVRLSAIRRMFEQFTKFALSDEIQKKSMSYIEKIDMTEKLIATENKRLEDEETAKQKRLAKLAKDAENVGTKEDQPKLIGEYTAKGKLGGTGKNTKTPASHRLFDDEGEVLYDLRWDDGDLRKLLGAKVGIVGVIKEYKNWPHKVIVITRIDVLSDEEEK